MKKKSNKKGFTIMEMLIVVAIIAVLAAIAIPTFNGALTKSKEAADVANIRAAYAEVVVAHITDGAPLPTTKGDSVSGNTTVKGFDSYLPSSLNYPDKYAVATDKVTYTAAKLEGGKTYTWNLKNVTD